MTAETIPAWPTARARVAALSRSRTDDDPEMLRARGDLQAARLAEHIARVLADAPTPSTEQLGRLALLLRAGPARDLTAVPETAELTESGGSPDAAA